MDSGVEGISASEQQLAAALLDPYSSTPPLLTAATMLEPPSNNCMAPNTGEFLHFPQDPPSGGLLRLGSCSSSGMVGPLDLMTEADTGLHSGQPRQYGGRYSQGSCAEGVRIGMPQQQGGAAAGGEGGSLQVMQQFGEAIACFERPTSDSSPKPATAALPLPHQPLLLPLPMPEKAAAGPKAELEQSTVALVTSGVQLNQALPRGDGDDFMMGEAMLVSRSGAGCSSDGESIAAGASSPSQEAEREAWCEQRSLSPPGTAELPFGSPGHGADLGGWPVPCAAPRPEPTPAVAAASTSSPSMQGAQTLLDLQYTNGWPQLGAAASRADAAPSSWPMITSGLPALSMHSHGTRSSPVVPTLHQAGAAWQPAVAMSQQPSSPMERNADPKVALMHAEQCNPGPLVPLEHLQVASSPPVSITRPLPAAAGADHGSTATRQLQRRRHSIGSAAVSGEGRRRAGGANRVHSLPPRLEGARAAAEALTVPAAAPHGYSELMRAMPQPMASSARVEATHNKPVTSGCKPMLVPASSGLAGSEAAVARGGGGPMSPALQAQEAECGVAALAAAETRSCCPMALAPATAGALVTSCASAVGSVPGWGPGPHAVEPPAAIAPWSRSQAAMGRRDSPAPHRAVAGQQRSSGRDAAPAALLQQQQQQLQQQQLLLPPWGSALGQAEAPPASHSFSRGPAGMPAPSTGQGGNEAPCTPLQGLGCWGSSVPSGEREGVWKRPAVSGAPATGPIHVPLKRRSAAKHALRQHYSMSHVMRNANEAAAEHLVPASRSLPFDGLPPLHDPRQPAAPPPRKASAYGLPGDRPASYPPPRVRLHHQLPAARARSAPHQAEAMAASGMWGARGELPADPGMLPHCTLLFKKVMTASDTSKLGRMVLPRAEAEAHFQEPEDRSGLAIKVHDVHGGQWVWKFKFWNNGVPKSKRMYVLEGMRPFQLAHRVRPGSIIAFYANMDHSLLVQVMPPADELDGQESGSGCEQRAAG